MANPFTSKTTGFMPTDYDTEAQQIERSRKYAEMLQAQAMRPDDTNQMVSGRVVAYSPLQGLAKMLQAYGSRKMMEEADQKQADLTKRKQDDFSDTAKRYAAALRGTDAQVKELPQGQEGPPELVAPAVPGSREAALQVAMNSGSPQWQQFGMQQMMKDMEPQKPVVVGRTLMDSTGKVIGVDSTWKEEQQAGRQQRMQELEMRLQDQRLAREDRAAMQRELLSVRREMAEATRAAGRDKAPSGYRFNPDGSLAPIPGGPADPKTKTGPDGMPKLTEAQGKANLYQSRATEADKIMTGLEGQYSPMAINAKQGAGKVWGIGGALETVGNAMLPANAQKVEQAQRDFVNAVLRQESGAVISDQEFANAQKQYFPQPGDSQAVIEQKRKNRNTAIEGLRVMAGPAANMRPAGNGGFTIIGVDE